HAESLRRHAGRTAVPRCGTAGAQWPCRGRDRRLERAAPGKVMPDINRRELLRSAAAALVAPAAGPIAPRQGATRCDRDCWLAHARKLAEPVLASLAAGTLHAKMPVEQAANTTRGNVTHLEAFGRLLAGIAPWIESGDSPYRDLALHALARAVDPASPDFMNFTRQRQPLVGAAVLRHGLLRAPQALPGRRDSAAQRTPVPRA